MRKALQHLLLFERFEIKTRMPKKDVLKNLYSLTDPYYTDYYGVISDDRFFIAEKDVKYEDGVSSKTSFPPVAKGIIYEKDGFTFLSGVLRMNVWTEIFIVPLYLLFSLMILPFPFLHWFFKRAFFKPARAMKETMENLLWDK